MKWTCGCAPPATRGPAAVSLKSFADYHASESWTWEHMALTRARLVAGPRRFARAGGSGNPPPPDPAARSAAPSSPMRATCGAHGRDISRAAIVWDLKYAPGGLVDIEFIAQTLATGPCARAARHPGHQHHRGAGEICGRRVFWRAADADAADRSGPAAAGADPGAAHRAGRDAADRRRDARPEGAADAGRGGRQLSPRRRCRLAGCRRRHARNLQLV